MKYKGNLKDYGFPKILIDLNRNRKTGILTVKSTNSTKKLFIDNGNAVFASSNREDERFGEMLIKAGKITIEQYSESVKLLKKGGKRQGAILVELGYLKPQDLIWGVKYQVKEIIYSLFLVDAAEYDFEEGELPLNEVVTVKMSMGNLIYEGVKRIDNLTMIMREMPGMDAVLKLSSDPVSLFQNIVLGPRDKQMLSMINGEKTVRELVDSSSTGSFEAVKTLYVLHTTGIIADTDAENVEDFVSLSIDEILSPAPEDEELTRNVNDMYEKISELSAHQLLGVEEKADIDSINKGYYKLVKEFHPDRYLSIDDKSTKDKALHIFEAINKAYSVMIEEDKISDYLLSLGAGKDGTGAPVTVDTLEDADTLIADNKYSDAMDIYNKLLMHEPDNITIKQRIDELRALMDII
jgi:hypothetical protein